MLRSSLLKTRCVLKKKKIIPQHCGHSYSSWACRSLPEPLRWGGRAGGRRVGSSSLRVTQRWAQPKSPNSHADAPHPSDSITPQLPSLSCCLVDGDPPLAPKTLSALLPSLGLPQRAGRGSGVLAAPEGPSRSAGHRLCWKCSPTAALSLQSGKNVTRKAAHPWLCYAAV